MAHTTNHASARSRYEYRVWGKHRKIRKQIIELAESDAVTEEINDCYLISDDEEWNAKVRDDRLKLKHLGKEKRGFERWDSQWPEDSDATPSPWDDVYDQLRLDKPARGKNYNLSKAVKKLDDDAGVRAVFVTKQRKVYRIGNVRAEIVKIDLRDGSKRLHSIAVQGRDLKELRALIGDLGLDAEPNVPMHVAIEQELIAS
jgi:hypothetical protein